MGIRILLVLLVAALVRLVALGSNPAGVFHDEAEKGYSAYSLLRVGGTLDFTRPVHISDGVTAPAFHKWPLFVDVWGSLTSMIYQYVDMPFVAVFGLNPWSLRMPAAIVGILTALLTFFLARRLTENCTVAFWAMLLVALSPWHIIFSRWAQQGVFVPLFLSAGLLALLAARKAAWQPFLLYLAAAMCFGLAFYAYSGAQPFLLLFYSVVAWLWRGEIRKNKFPAIAAALFLICLILPTLYATFGQGGAGTGRLQRLSIFQMDEPAPYKAFLFVKNYLAHFSPQFLFFTGDPLDRHGFRGFGVMLHVEIFFLIAGLYTAVRRRSFGDRVLLAWFLLFPVSAAITNEGIPHALRTLHAIPCPQILSAIGAVALTQWVRNQAGSIGVHVFKIAFALNACILLVVLFFYYPHYSAPSFEYGVRQAIQTAQSHGALKNPDYRVYIPPESGIPLVPELFHFHAKTPPKQLLDEGVQSAQIQIIPSLGRHSYSILQLLHSGDSLLLAPALANQANAGSFSETPILWRPHPFRKTAIPSIVIITAR